MKKQIFFLHVGILLIVSVLALIVNRDCTAEIDNLRQSNLALKTRAGVNQKYAIAVEKELIQAWMDVCLFKTEADMSDDYDKRYMDCKCIVVDDMNKLVEGL